LLASATGDFLARRRLPLRHNGGQMTRYSLFAAAACAWFTLAASSIPLRAELKPEELYSAVSPSIVALDVENFAGKHFVGTAFLAAGNRLAVTAWHVVHDARRVEARFADNQRVTVTGLVDKNEKLDLALLQLEAGPRPRITLASAAPRIGSRVYLVGSPRGFDFSISEGLISQIRTLDGVRYYQLSCPISPGDSGGPVLNDRGEAIGVVSWRKADAENVGFAIPSPEVAQMNAALPAVAWPEAVARSQHAANAPDAAPLVRGAVATRGQSAADAYLGFQEFLSGHSGERVTVIVQEHGEETHFNFEVPKPAAK
jgi:S1-C subfamily serine protease